MKDYYSILELKATATIPEIKQAYRKLVMIYHPDKNNADPYAQIRFADIREAYDTLSNPIKKEQYLQERWLMKAHGRSAGQEMITPPNLLKQALEINQSISQMDHYRMDHHRIVHQISALFSDDVMQKLIDFGETEINQTIVQTLIKAIQPLPLQAIDQLKIQLLPLLKNDPLSLQQFNKLIKQKKIQQQQDRYQPILVLFIVITICFLIWYTANK